MIFVLCLASLQYFLLALRTEHLDLLNASYTGFQLTRRIIVVEITISEMTTPSTKQSLMKRDHTGQSQLSTLK
jgi:hypothetical protein